MNGYDWVLDKDQQPLLVERDDNDYCGGSVMEKENKEKFAICIASKGGMTEEIEVDKVEFAVGAEFIDFVLNGELVAQYPIHSLDHWVRI